ncbi:hypothetical protein Tco_1504437 [Tanacetum coccineum]
MHFLLTTLKVVYVLSTPMPEFVEDEPLEQTRKRCKWENDNYIYRRHILNGISDALFDVYQNVGSEKELQDQLESKYMVEDASSKKFLVSNFNNYKMVDSRAYVETLNKKDSIARWQNKTFLHPLSQKIPIIRKDLEEEPAPTGETSIPPAPNTAKQLAAKRNQERVKSILLLAIPDEYLLKFHNVVDAKSLWEAIKSRFGGNEKFKKMQKNVLKHQFDRFQKLISQLEVHGAPISKEDINEKFLRSLPPSWNQIALIIRNKPDIDEIDIDDLYNNLGVYEDEMKRSSSSTPTSQNLAFLSSENTSSTNEVSTASRDCEVSTAGGTSQVLSTLCAHDVAYSFFAQPTTSPQLENEDFYSIRGQEGTWISRKNDLYRRNQGKRSYGDNGRSNAPTNKSSSQALVAQDGLGGYDWSNEFEVEPVNYALMAISSSSSSSSSNSEVQKCSKKCLESFKTLQKNYDSEREKHSRATLEIQGYELALESQESRILGHEMNELAWGEKYEFQNYELNQMSARDKTSLGYGTQLNEMSNNSETDSEISLRVFDVRSSEEESIPANDRSSKADGYYVVPPPITVNFLTPRADISFAVNRDKVIIEDWNSEDEDDVSEVQTVIHVKTNESQTVKPRVDKIGVLTKTGLTIPIKQNEKRAVHTVSIARPVSTARSVSIAKPVCTAMPVCTARLVSTVRPFAPKIAQTSGAIRPIYPRMDNGNSRESCYISSSGDSGAWCALKPI